MSSQLELVGPEPEVELRSPVYTPNDPAKCQQERRVRDRLDKAISPWFAPGTVGSFKHKMQWENAPELTKWYSKTELDEAREWLRKNQKKLKDVAVDAGKDHHIVSASALFASIIEKYGSTKLGEAGTDDKETPDLSAPKFLDDMDDAEEMSGLVNSSWAAVEKVGRQSFDGNHDRGKGEKRTRQFRGPREKPSQYVFIRQAQRYYQPDGSYHDVFRYVLTPEGEDWIRRKKNNNSVQDEFGTTEKKTKRIEQDGMNAIDDIVGCRKMTGGNRAWDAPGWQPMLAPLPMPPLGPYRPWDGDTKNTVYKEWLNAGNATDKQLCRLTGTKPFRINH